MIFARCLLLLLCFLFVSGKSHAKFFKISDYHTYGPIQARPQNPLNLLFVHSAMEGVQTLPPKKWSASVDTAFSNIFERDPRLIGVGLDVDMELIRTAFSARVGVTKAFEVGAEVPFLSFSGGFLDSFIQDYHSAFGFPNGGRGAVDNGRFAYSFSKNGGVLYSVDQAAFRLGDVSLWGKIKLFDEAKGQLGVALKTVVKLPTGSVGQGTGSGRPDASASVIVQKSYKRLHSYTQVGAYVLGGHQYLNPILKNGGAFFGQAFEINLFEYASLLAQIWIESPQINAATSYLSEPLTELTVGFTGDVPVKEKKIKYQIGFTEDPTGSGPAVDFSVFLRLGMDM